MTGFARARKTIEQGDITVTLKSVNHRGLDLLFHMSSERDALENEIRGAVKNHVARGHLQIHVSLVRSKGATGALNRRLLDTYLDAFQEASKLYQFAGQPDLNAALRIPGMLTIENEEELDAEIRKAVLDAVGEALAALNVFREREGAATVVEIRQRAQNLGGLVNRMEEIREGAGC